MALYTATVTIQHPGTSGGTAVNVWHFRTSGAGPDGPNLQGASDALEAFYNEIKDVYPTGTTIDFDGDWVNARADDPL